jgi:hypothetical protein
LKKTGIQEKANGAGTAAGAEPERSLQRRPKLTDLEFGLILTVVGMGGTMIILYLVSLTISAANKFFPYWEKRKLRVSAGNIPAALADKVFPEGDKKRETAK